LLFDVDVELSMSKADRMNYGVAMLNHVMAFTGVSVDDNGKPVKWRVENSWGEDCCHKGFIVMTTDYFREFGFEVVVDKKFIPDEVMQVFDTEPIVVPAWDPLGNLK